MSAYGYEHGSLVEHASHTWEEWSAHLSCDDDMPEWAENENGLCCHTCETIVIADTETCSHCTGLFMNDDLAELPDGARVCHDCDSDYYDEKRMSDIDHADYMYSIQD